jgi:hypothetical protein
MVVNVLTWQRRKQVYDYPYNDPGVCCLRYRGLEAEPRSSLLCGIVGRGHWRSFCCGRLLSDSVGVGRRIRPISVSPWSNVGLTAPKASAVAIAWLVIIEVIGSAFGGYLTGRLRTKWTLVHTDEVFFRDTANGFLAWAVALVVSVAFLASAATSMAGSTAQARASSANATENAIADPSMYYVDALFRPKSVPTRATRHSNRKPSGFWSGDSGRSRFQVRTKPIWSRSWPLERASASPMQRNAFPM